MIDHLLKWFERTRITLAPRSITGREVAWSNGYSLLELERAGISEQQAAMCGLEIDRERNSALGSNVMQLEKLRAAQGWKNPA
jgi:ribosomal protein L13E